MNTIRCLCLRCGNENTHSIDTVKEHYLFIYFYNGIDQIYTSWLRHNENICASSRMCFDTNYDVSSEDEEEDNMVEMVNDAEQDFVGWPEQFTKLLDDA